VALVNGSITTYHKSTIIVVRERTTIKKKAIGVRGKRVLERRV